jgi:hypothetical protein
VATVRAVTASTRPGDVDACYEQVDRVVALPGKIRGWTGG